MKRKILLILMLVYSLVSSASSLFVSSHNTIIHADTALIALGGNAFFITSGDPKDAIVKEGIHPWKSEKSTFNTYFKNEIARKCDLYISLLTGEFSSRIKFTLGTQSYVTRISPGQKNPIFIGQFNLSAGYQSIALEGLSKDSDFFPSISSFTLLTQEPGEFNFVKDNIDKRFYWGRRGPSVHLTYTEPEGKNIKWFYNEVTIPKGLDPVGSYFMANGFAEGYFGFQVNSETERRILFSVWSPFKTDNPASIPEDQKIKLLKKGAGVYTGEFGNEGSGGQSYLKYQWEAGKRYQFLNSVEPDGHGATIYTAYFKEYGSPDWLLIASFNRPKTETWYKRPHSFVENFNPNFGHVVRQAHYSNQWLCDSNGQWFELTEAKFTGDDIAKRGYRKDYEGGEKAGYFYLQNGGFFNGKVPLNQSFKRAKSNEMPIIDFKKLP
jgi:hypothetical protein